MFDRKTWYGLNVVFFGLAWLTARVYGFFHPDQESEGLLIPGLLAAGMTCAALDAGMLPRVIARQRQPKGSNLEAMVCLLSSWTVQAALGLGYVALMFQPWLIVFPLLLLPLDAFVLRRWRSSVLSKAS